MKNITVLFSLTFSTVIFTFLFFAPMKEVNASGTKICNIKHQETLADGTITPWRDLSSIEVASYQDCPIVPADHLIEITSHSTSNGGFIYNYEGRTPNAACKINGTAVVVEDLEIR